jgi:hypothetical protein
MTRERARRVAQSALRRRPLRTVLRSLSALLSNAARAAATSPLFAAAINCSSARMVRC